MKPKDRIALMRLRQYFDYPEEPLLFVLLLLKILMHNMIFLGQIK